MTDVKPPKKRGTRKPSGAHLPDVRARDPGDETERNYRYQHAYGVVLLTAVHRGTSNYLAIYCEHHEDFLCERPDGKFDGFQVKTSTPENGAWHMLDAAVVGSIGRFVDLVAAYDKQIGQLFFVSNTATDEVKPETKDQAQVGRCPLLFLTHLKACETPAEIQEPFKKVFDRLAAELGECDPQLLLSALRRLDFIRGPSRGDFDAVLSHEHIRHVPGCQHMDGKTLDALRESIVARLHRAASLHVTDPERHLRGLFSRAPDPAIESKKIVCADVTFDAGNVATTVPFAFEYTGQPQLKLGGGTNIVIEKKLRRGKLDEHLVTHLKDLALSAEHELLERQIKEDPATFEKALRQVEKFVHGECLEAFTASKTSDSPFGEKMFTDLASRLRKLASERKTHLGQVPYELLLGTAALLTGECRIWWSERFSLDEEAE